MSSTRIIAYALTYCFHGLFSLITTYHKLRGPFLSLWSEPQGFGFPTSRTPNDHLAPPCQGPEAMTDVAPVSLQGAHDCLVATGDPVLRPLLVGGQPAPETLVQQ
jgi:hypothetical protein